MQIKSKVSKSIGVLNRLKHLLTSKLLLMVYNSLILPYLTYCNLIWSNAYESRLIKIKVMQRKAIRIIVKAEYLAHADPLFKKLRLLKISDIGQQQISIFIYKFLKNDLPANFQNYFCSTADIHPHYTRQSSGLHILYSKTNIRKKSIKIAGPHFWNNLPLEVKQSNSLIIFKKHLKHYLLSLY